MRPNQAIFLYGKPCRNEKLTETAVGGFSGWQLVPILSAYAYQEALLLVPAYRGHGGLMVPAHATLADRAGCSPRTVQRALLMARQLREAAAA